MKICITILLAFLMTGCVLFRNTVEIGMDESEFKKNNVHIYLAEMTADYTVYRMPQSEDSDLYVYFENGKLVRVQERINRPKIRIEKN